MSVSKVPAIEEHSLPCCAYLNTQPSPAERGISIREKIAHGESPFSWRDPANIPSSDPDAITHLSLLDEFQIPYIFDIHAHFFPETVMQLIWKWFDRVNWKIGYRIEEQGRLEYLHKNGVRRFTTLNYAHKPGMAAWLNEWVFENHRKWEGAVPFGTFYPEDGVLEYAGKAVEQFGFRGFKLHCEVAKLDLNRTELADVFSFLAQKRLPIVIHTGTAPVPGPFTGISHFSKFIQKFPDLKVIVAHMGAYEIREYLSLLPEYENLFFDTTMVFVDFLATGEDTGELFAEMEKRPDRFVFGSDFPNIPYNLSHPISVLLTSELSAETKRKIFYKNAERIVG